ncbi:MAG: hypothetical protein WC875_01130 [Candidatus Absconditabacterales bacterium]|jgi:hypothetical protein
MIKTKISWKDFRKKSPPPHYLCPDSDIIVEYDGETIKMAGQCLFPSSDQTLKSRNHVNHFHVIMLIDVVCALNVLWNAARIAKEKFGWKEMLSITTKSKITQKLVLDKKYSFHVQAKRAKLGIWKITLHIADKENVVADVKSTAQVE